MGNIEQLLESDMKSQYSKLLLARRKNSHCHLPIVTTARADIHNF